MNLIATCPLTNETCQMACIKEPRQSCKDLVQRVLKDAQHIGHNSIEGIRNDPKYGQAWIDETIELEIMW